MANQFSQSGVGAQRIPLTTLLLLLMLPINASGQTQSRVVKKITFSGALVELTGASSQGMPVNFAEDFSATDDWLKTFVLQVKNSSGKPITCININVDFPETRAPGGMMRYFLRYGERPYGNGRSSKPNIEGASNVIMPNDSVGLRWSETAYSQLKRFIETRQPLETINKIELSLGAVCFADETIWDGGNLYRIDSGAPRGVRMVESPEDDR